MDARHHLRHLPMLVAWAVLAPAAVVAQPVAAADAVAQRVDAIFAEWDRSDSPGCALGVYHDGAIVYSRGYGMADLERGVPITPRSIFDIGSTSKQFTAAAILLLADERKLGLDDDVRKWIPELPSYGKRITLRHMLLHTSGLRDYIGLLTMAGARTGDVTDADDALRIIARQKALNFEPGAEYLYSNSGYFLLSVVVQRVSGQTLQAFARERIFLPLGMTRTHYLASYDAIVPDRALAYGRRPGERLRLDVPRWQQVGDGAVLTSVEDLLHWDNNFHEPRVGGKRLISRLQSAGRLANGNTLTYALGLAVRTYRGERVVSHGGAWGGYRAELVRFPKQRFSVATLCNVDTTDPSALALQVADVYLEGTLRPVDAPPAGEPHTTRMTSELLAPYAGTYRNPSTRARLQVAVIDGVLTVAGDGRFSLRRRSGSSFGASGTQTTWTFEGIRGGMPARVRRQQRGRNAEVFEKIPARAPTPEGLAPYTGRFYSDELDTTWTLSIESGGLMLRRRGAEPQRLLPLVEDEFMSGSATVRFTRGRDREIAGFVLDLGRVRNLTFEKR